MGDLCRLDSGKLVLLLMVLFVVTAEIPLREEAGYLAHSSLAQRCGVEHLLVHPLMA